MHPPPTSGAAHGTLRDCLGEQSLPAPRPMYQTSARARQGRLTAAGRLAGLRIPHAGEHGRAYRARWACLPAKSRIALPMRPTLGGTFVNSDNNMALEERVLVSSTEAAQMLGISPRTLANWRVQGRGPAYVRLGKSRSPILYRVSDIDAWLESRLVGGKSTGKTSGIARR